MSGCFAGVLCKVYKGHTLGVSCVIELARGYPLKFQKFKKGINGASTVATHIPLISIDDIGDRVNAGFRDQ